MIRRAAALLLVAGALGLTLGACGDDESTTDTTPAESTASELTSSTTATTSTSTSSTSTDNSTSTTTTDPTSTSETTSTTSTDGGGSKRESEDAAEEAFEAFCEENPDQCG